MRAGTDCCEAERQAPSPCRPHCCSVKCTEGRLSSKDRVIRLSWRCHRTSPSLSACSFSSSCFSLHRFLSARRRCQCVIIFRLYHRISSSMIQRTDDNYIKKENRSSNTYDVCKRTDCQYQRAVNHLQPSNTWCRTGHFHSRATLQWDLFLQLFPISPIFFLIFQNFGQVLAL